MWSRIREDVLVAFERDPAARSTLEVILCYPGIHALLMHRVAHSLWLRGARLPARLLSAFARFLTGVEIHPGARIGRRVFIDHGMGVVVGETAEIGNDVLIYQGVSLGGTSLTKGKRHPTIEDYVVIGLGSTVLGPVTVGRHSRVGAGSVVVASVPPHSTVVGVPGRIVSEAAAHSAEGVPLLSLEHGQLPDPLVRTINGLAQQVARLEREVSELRDGQAAEGEAEPPPGEDPTALAAVKRS
ncbi:MAG TPA: serine O-acetyltransferase [Candidatus Binatia bacterium]|nr:serine O-acetyltransferase [Candidatus Binatia bacterium]